MGRHKACPYISDDERDPFAILIDSKITHAQFQQTRLNQVNLRIENPGKDQMAAGRAEQRRKQINNDRRSQIRADQISGQGLFIDSSHAKCDLIANPVQPRVLFSDLDRFGVRVARFDAHVWKHFRRRYRQDARSSSHIEKTAAAEMFLNALQTQPRGFVRACAKRHARFDANYDVSVRTPTPVRSRF